MTTFQEQWPVVRERVTTHIEDFSLRAAAHLSALGRRVRNARQARLFVLELAGVVLITFAISLWSLPSAIIVGGLVLVAAVEVRPHVNSPLPPLPVPEVLLRAQAEQAARLLNNARFGVAEVDVAALDRLSRDECERIITIARKYEAEASA
jgi:hypothetical protein